MTPISHLSMLAFSGDQTMGSFVLAQTDAAPPVAGRPDGGAVTGESGQPLGGGQSAPPPQGFGFQLVFLVAGLMLFMVVTQVFAGRKEKRRRAEMLGSLRRHDRVVTIGGIIGHVVEVRDDEVVLKIDESTNTKVRVTRTAVQSVLKKSSAEERPAVETAKA